MQSDVKGNVPFSLDLAGEMLGPGDDGYAESRSIFNMRREQDRPALIIRAADADDVVKVMRYATLHKLPIAIRGGGHGVDGTAMPHGAVVLDLTRLRDVSIDKVNGRVKVGAGILLGDIDKIGQENGLVVPSGTVSHTGVAGLTLGGGVGMLMRRYGATVDNLFSCDVVTTDGRKIVASESENADLFWALRGGGGNFGVVTAFEYRGHPVGPEVTAGPVIFPIEQAGAILRQAADMMPAMPRELGLICTMTLCPPFPPVPAEYHGKLIFLMLFVHSGALDDGSAEIAKVTSLGKPIADLVTTMPWVNANSMLDDIAPWGRRCHTRGAYMSDLPDEAIRAMIEHSRNAPELDYQPPAPPTAQNVWFMGGAISEDFDEDSKAFSREGARFFWEAFSLWDQPENGQRMEGWVDGVADALAPWFRKNCYVNLTTDRGPEWFRDIYGSAEKFQRLLEAKAKWDPHNLLRFNKNFVVDR